MIMRKTVQLKRGGIDEDYRLITQAEFGIRAGGREVTEIRCSPDDQWRIMEMRKGARERMGRYDVPWVRQMLDDNDADVAFGAKVVVSGRVRPGTVIVVGE